MRQYFGIDLGTTNSVIAHVVDGVPVALPVDGSAIVPSVVLFDGDRVIAGREARNLELRFPELTVRSAKRKMGLAHRYRVGTREVSPEEVSAEILRALARGASAATQAAVEDVVITVPAYFDDAQRRATLRAGELAGLNVLRLLNEPTSASLVYERVTGAAGGDGPEIVLIYDLGGGTFDVSVLEVFEGVREVRATLGNTTLGGDDFDEMLVRLFLDHLKRQGVDPREDAAAMARLRHVAEAAKIALSRDTVVPVREEFLATAGGRPVHLECEVSRRQLEQLVAPLLASTVELALRAVRDAGLAPDDVQRICLVGGSTRIPLVRSLLEDAFRAEVHEEIDPDLAVALGASIQSAVLQGADVARILVDVAAHSLGIRVLGAEDSGLGEPDTFAPLIPRNTALPAQRADEFYTVAEDQDGLLVEVFQGEATRVSQNTRVGSFELALESRPAGSPVRVEFTYDLNGVVNVSVSQPGTTNQKTVALAVPDTSAEPRSGAPAAQSAVERRARALLERLAAPERARLLELLEAFSSGTESQRARAEDTLLDFFLEHESEATEPAHAD